LGETPEEILARLQAKNVMSSAGLGAPGTTPATPPTATPPASAKPTGPLLPTSIGTPVQKPATPATGPGTASAIAPAKTEMPNPLLSILTGINPAALLTKHVEKDAPDVDKLRAEVDKTDDNAITKSAQSFTGINLAVDLQRLPSPTLILHGKSDPLLPAPSEDLLRHIMRGKPEGHLLAFVEPDLRHFPMLEITAKFNRLLMDFLEAQDLTNVQFKDQWQRTMR
jgi:pimeloyl-ACP methyl ester carboxylesterase